MYYTTRTMLWEVEIFQDRQTKKIHSLSLKEESLCLYTEPVFAFPVAESCAEIQKDLERKNLIYYFMAFSQSRSCETVPFNISMMSSNQCWESGSRLGPDIFGQIRILERAMAVPWFYSATISGPNLWNDWFSNEEIGSRTLVSTYSRLLFTLFLKALTVSR
jgi:hypothetical protein